MSISNQAMEAPVSDLWATMGAPRGLVGGAAGPHPLLTGCILGGLGCRWFIAGGPRERREGGRAGQRATGAVTGLVISPGSIPLAFSGTTQNAL